VRFARAALRSWVLMMTTKQIAGNRQVLRSMQGQESMPGNVAIRYFDAGSSRDEPWINADPDLIDDESASPARPH
jgi:hypothetical protein